MAFLLKILNFHIGKTEKAIKCQFVAIVPMYLFAVDIVRLMHM